uniref:MFS domain-containing protein n=1 Tax=Heterorhabditis bacteriophora TaxID=37862 RepID=A0A1I7XST4_HETBA
MYNSKFNQLYHKYQRLFQLLNDIGRKKVFYLALVIQTLCGLLLAIAPTWWLFALLKWEQLELNQNSKNISFGLFDLVRTTNMRKRTLVCFFLWPVTTMMYYGLTMKSDLGGGSLYINFAISALMEIPAIFIVYMLIDRIGRRQLVTCGLLTAGTCLIFNWIVGDNGGYYNLNNTMHQYQNVKREPVPFYWGMLQMMITKGAVTISYTAMYTYTSELFPTVIRNTAVGCCSTIARLGAISSSYIALWLVDSYGKLFMVIPFSLLSVVAAILSAVFLPETMDKPMPESISEVEGTHI